MHDTAALENKGIPTVAVLSLGFVTQAKYQAEMLGLEQAVAVFVKHPISNATADEMVAKGRDVFPLVLRGLTSVDDLPAYPDIPADDKPLSADQAEECTT
mmetsp:Transcript_64085/g.151614  ORF Transcript_64085/g.151614 Transcript_64085/m.151614 type:complete len:100 (+) Transcript_64085:1276-1575(+)